ncbi:hypothetical protein MMC12_003229 [Toensbergia leucococca]|nr:hypothetical protein [Toensbergia leucococca]
MRKDTAGTVRRRHKKSTAGCRECKARKVKCDEARPVCGPCAKRFVNPRECAYLSPHNKPATAIPSQTPSNADENPPIGPASHNETRVLELRLFYHYATSTCGLLPVVHDLRVKEMWAVDVPQMAFEFEYLLNAVFGIAALHLLTLNPTDSSMKYAAHAYLDKAVQAYRDAVLCLDEMTAKPLFVTTVLIQLQARLLFCTFPYQQEEAYKLPLHYLSMVQGARAVYFAASTWFQGTNVMAYVNAEPVIGDQDWIAYRQSTEGNQTRFTPLLDGLEVGNTTSQIREIYGETLSYIDSIHSAILLKEPHHYIHRRLVVVAAKFSHVFLDMLRHKDPRAMAILAHYFALMKFVDSVWWLKGIAEVEVHGINSLMPSEWHWAMKWPLQIVEKVSR